MFVPARIPQELPKLKTVHGHNYNRLVVTNLGFIKAVRLMVNIRIPGTREVYDPFHLIVTSRDFQIQVDNSAHLLNGGTGVNPSYLSRHVLLQIDPPGKDTFFTMILTNRIDGLRRRTLAWFG